ncbi:ABC transporter ATP-binding protein [Sporomusa acidovorans]|uniref:Oligopeptide transport ATP-binding protein OppF n=1 Tax=Sporomusa acidovorans (strain ATCC 49682 / DSM 3132 / Mol) TaxID=1123286 RepID=A0ABZ3J5F7_SPOA4|nr:dipeptide/oligopeptide/nickel ABC transporter ATP-binding protein [Sporomusa acidovorans]OZC23947.1 oligopeptide transport ATP-binding protein OppF [Sporomusa acidovorans DSM 3132]SDF31863.1 peptide/nickel transport system ATP-binding protein [Sporomusa acidovorans]
MLEVIHLTKTFAAGLWGRTRTTVVDDVSFSVKAGTTLGLVGRSGSGKSTLARLVVNLIPCDTGRIIFNGVEISRFTTRQMKPLRKDMQILFQNPETSLNPRLSIGASLAEPYRLHGICDKEHIAGQIEMWLQFVGLDTGILSRQPYQLSGGQLQRICIARALLLQPGFLVLDEPTSMLDVSVQAQVIEVLKNAQKTYGIAYLFISHDLDLIKACSDEIAVMHRGRIIEQQPAAALYSQPREEYTKKLLAAFVNF